MALPHSATPPHSASKPAPPKQTDPVSQEEVTKGLMEVVDALKAPAFLERMKAAVTSAGLWPAAEVNTVAEAMVNQALVSVQWPDNPQKLELSFDWVLADIESAILRLAAKGLPYDPLAGVGWLTPRKSHGKPVPSPEPGIRGLERLIQGTGKVGIMRSQAIRAQDRYEPADMMGTTSPRIIRNMAPDTAKPNPVVGAIACAQIIGKGFHVVELPLDTTAIQKLEKATELGRNPNYGVEKRAEYAAKRQLMREVIQTYLHDRANLVDLAGWDEKSEQEARSVAPIYGAASSSAVSAVSAAKPVAASPAPVERENPIERAATAATAAFPSVPQPARPAIEPAKPAVPAPAVAAGVQPRGSVRLPGS
jgi:hypothetical protein